MDIKARIRAFTNTWREYRREPLAERIAAARTAFRCAETCEPRTWSM